MADRLEGSILEIVARNDLSGYTLLGFRHEGEVARMVVFLSVMPRAGERFAAQGEWRDHKRFGRQFRATEFVVTSPASREELIAFLSSGLFPGVGEGLARRIVQEFGESALETIEKYPKALYRVPGFGESKVVTFLHAWSRHSGLRAVSLRLAPFGFSLSLAGKVWAAWAHDTLQIINETPYRLFHDFSGATFNLVDRMALSEKPALKTSLDRAEAAMHDILSNSFGEGHSCLPRTELVKRTVDRIEIERSLAERTVDGLVSLGEMSEETWGPLTAVYSPGLRKAEEDIAKGLAALANGRPRLSAYARTDVIRALSNARGVSLSPSQEAALRVILSQPVSVLTGGPGTGKSRITQFICDAGRAANIPIHLGAPTGRAASRLSDCTGLAASTIHRLLAYHPGFERFQINAEAPLASGLVVVDEASMLDVLLAAHLVRAIGLGSQVVFIGDVDQLPSVGPGSVLRDIIAAFPGATARLTEIHRQSAGSLIVRNAHGFLRGNPIVSPPPEEKSDFQFRPAETDAQVVAQIRSTLAKLKARGVDVLKEVQILSPARKGSLGSVALNKELQSVLLPGRERITGAHGLMVGDRIVQRTNDYEREVFNGQLGIVKSIDSEQRIVVLEFDGRAIDYAFTDLDEVELAWCLTTHKGQGSEFWIVIYVVHPSHGPLLSRQLIYTAITRAKRLLIMIGDPEALEIAQENAAVASRYGSLHARLRAALPPLRETQSELIAV